MPETRRGTIYVTNIAKFQINIFNKPGQLSVDDWLKINTCNKPGKLYFFSHKRLIPETRQDNYLNDRQKQVPD